MALIALIGLGGCTADPPAPEPLGPAVVTGPEGDAFYQPPTAPAEAKPGDVIWVRKIPAPQDAEGFAILYWSTVEDGSLVAVSGVAFAPSATPPSKPRSIVAWAHGTVGLGDSCAPSHGFFKGAGDSLPVVKLTVAQGAIFVASDYQGLGTPGEHPFMVNEASARNVLDSIRAATQLFNSTGSNAVIIGQSQGGAAALFAAELQPKYAPDVSLKGTAAAAVPTKIDTVNSQLASGLYFGFVLMSMFGYLTAYPQLRAHDTELTPAGRVALAEIGSKCVDAILADYAGRTEAEYGTDVVLGAPDFRARMVSNDLGRVPPPTPIMIIHGDRDGAAALDNVRQLKDRYCAQAVAVTAKVYLGKGHVDVFQAALTEIVNFLNDRLDGKPATSTCSG